MIDRPTDTRRVRAALKRSRVVALLGPRQCGKTTLARQFVSADSLNQRDLELHPKVGASWEGYAVEEVLKALEPDEAYYWATHQGAEIDLVLFKHGRRIGVECKRSDAPGLTPSMRTAVVDLKLDRLVVVYPGDRGYALADQVQVIPLAELAETTGSSAGLFKRRRG